MDSHVVSSIVLADQSFFAHGGVDQIAKVLGEDMKNLLCVPGNADALEDPSLTEVLIRSIGVLVNRYGPKTIFVVNTTEMDSRRVFRLTDELLDRVKVDPDQSSADAAREMQIRVVSRAHHAVPRGTMLAH